MTPFLDGWMSSGARFERAYSATPSCIAARAALFTGLGQERHGRAGDEDGGAWEFDVAPAGALARAGDHAPAVGRMHVHPERTPMGFGDAARPDGDLHVARRSYDARAEVDDDLAWLREGLGYQADY